MSDNLGLRGVLDVITIHEAFQLAGPSTQIDHVCGIVVVIVNSLSIPATDWARSVAPPGTVSVLLKAAGVPIDRYSGEQVE